MEKLILIARLMIEAATLLGELKKLFDKAALGVEIPDEDIEKGRTNIEAIKQKYEKML